MCQDCGCSQVGELVFKQGHYHVHSDGTRHSHEHDHHHEHGHHHEHDHHHHHQDEHGNGNEHSEHRTLHLAQAVLSKNERLAEQNRGYFRAKQVFVLNVLSSPGSGKTAFLERTLADLKELKPGVIVGDLETDNDAQRLRQADVPVVQITTGVVCHLEAQMVMQAAEQMDLDQVGILFIENVGNLVCPAAYDLGEALRVVMLSVTEGEDKPLKYPTMFKSADVVIVTKIDIAEAVGFDRDRAIANIQKIAPQAKLFEVSARTGKGMSNWYDYLQTSLHQNVSTALVVPQR